MKLSVMSPLARDIEPVTTGATVELVCFDDSHKTPEILQLKIEQVIRDAGRLILQGTTDRMTQGYENPAGANCILQTDATLAPAGEIFLNPAINPEVS